ncbi:MAG: penicillin-binding protein 2 [Lachnospiraceae bacterium]|nr:penicillin-binding protein 2 [Lachnospiraceae bacterium]
MAAEEGKKKRKKISIFSKKKDRQAAAEGKALTRDDERRALRRTNREIMMVSYVFLLLFVVMAGYMIRFVYRDADLYKNDSRNAKRMKQLENKFLRGDIMAADETVLATTSVTEDGGESRSYPLGQTFAHVVGYTGRGTTGIEGMANSYLQDSHTNPALRIVEALRGIKSSADSVITTLDVGLQETAYSALSGHSGAIVVMEPGTGKVLAMVSRPGFDPNTLEEDWEVLTSESNTSSNLVNRATQGLYTPGSTFKVFTALEFLREYPYNYNEYSFSCDNVYEAGEYSIKCAHGVAHGNVDLSEAFAESCNGAFADIGQQLNFKEFMQTCEEAGFNTSLKTRVPIAKNHFVLDSNDSQWDVLQTSIGQGETQLTPMFNAMVASAVANGGTMMNPYVIDRVLSKYREKVASFGPARLRRIMSKDEARILKEYMDACVAYGTGDDAAGEGYHAYGKTGSAQTRSDRETNAWFIGWAEDSRDPERKVAVSIVVEEGGSGGSVAAPIAKQIFEEWRNRDLSEEQYGNDAQEEDASDEDLVG